MLVILCLSEQLSEGVCVCARACLYILHCEDQRLHFTSYVGTFLLVLLNSKGCLGVKSWCWWNGVQVRGCDVGACCIESPHKGTNTSVVVCMFHDEVCRFIFTTSELLLTGVCVWLWVVWDCIKIFLAHSAIIMGINIVIWLSALTIFILTPQKKNTFSEWKGNREKSKDFVCLFLCFGLLLFYRASVSLLDEWGVSTWSVWMSISTVLSFLYSETPVFSLPLLQ